MSGYNTEAREQEWLQDHARRLVYRWLVDEGVGDYAGLDSLAMRSARRLRRFEPWSRAQWWHGSHANCLAAD